jgi:hypothetical protein
MFPFYFNLPPHLLVLFSYNVNPFSPSNKHIHWKVKSVLKNESVQQFITVMSSLLFSLQDTQHSLLNNLNAQSIDY